MESITLTRKQIDQFVEFATHFPDIQYMTLEQGSLFEQGHESGIGASVVIKCSLFGNDSEPETTVDITDVSVW